MKCSQKCGDACQTGKDHSILQQLLYKSHHLFPISSSLSIHSLSLSPISFLVPFSFSIHLSPCNSDFSSHSHHQHYPKLPPLLLHQLCSLLYSSSCSCWWCWYCCLVINGDTPRVKFCHLGRWVGLILERLSSFTPRIQIPSLPTDEEGAHRNKYHPMKNETHKLMIENFTFFFL